jgi:hypothetical protein
MCEKSFVEIPNMDHNMCFGCGPANDHGLKMKFFGSENMIYANVSVPAYLLGWNGVVHGGILSTILDEGMSWGAIFLAKKFILTKSMTVNYHKPVLVGDMLRVESEIKEIPNDREALMSGRIINSNGDLCVSSTGVMALMEMSFVKKLGIMKDKDIEDFQKIIDASHVF